ncbi:MAG: winged helix-turn-helix transcriptional regulator [Caldilineales bacterium]|nr:winged helix-turn-helix transcriptional regulator [Caldilineales bacterium]
MPTIELMTSQSADQLNVRLEPAFNVLGTCVMMANVDDVSGLDEWVMQTTAGFSPQRRREHRLVMIGLHYAVLPPRSFSSFPAYVDFLATAPPTYLRDRLFDVYDGLDFCHSDNEPLPTSLDFGRDALVADADLFLTYLRSRFSEEYIEENLEREVHTLLQQPETLRDKVVSHFRMLWADTLADDWARNMPLLQACIEACCQIDLAKLTPYDALTQITGESPGDNWREKLDSANRVVFVPSAHMGPYLHKVDADDAIYVLFRARTPEGSQSQSPALRRSDLLVRLQALGDDTRLSILDLLVQEDGLCSPEIMDRLSLSQSAASRHLKQLSATGFLSEKRREGAKCYSLQKDQVQRVCQSLLQYLDAK